MTHPPRTAALTLASRLQALCTAASSTAAACLLLTSPLPAAAQNAALFQEVLRRDWSAGADGQPKEVTFQDFFVGSPRSYTLLDGAGGRPGTVVYPVRTTFTVRESYNREFQYSQRTRNFSCFLAEQGYWTCAMKGGGNFETKNWSVPR